MLLKFILCLLEGYIWWFLFLGGILVMTEGGFKMSLFGKIQEYLNNKVVYPTVFLLGVAMYSCKDNNLTSAQLAFGDPQYSLTLDGRTISSGDTIPAEPNQKLRVVFENPGAGSGYTPSLGFNLYKSNLAGDAFLGGSVLNFEPDPAKRDTLKFSIKPGKYKMATNPSTGITEFVVVPDGYIANQ